MHERRVPIPKPCQVEWQELTPLAKAGRYCAHCQHAVVDLSALTEAQAERLLRARKPNTCVSYLRDAEGRISFHAPSARDVNPVTAALGALLALAACSESSSGPNPQPALDSVAQPLGPSTPESANTTANSAATSNGCAASATDSAAKAGWPGAQHEANPNTDATPSVAPATSEVRRRRPAPPTHPSPKPHERERLRVSGLMMFED